MAELSGASGGGRRRRRVRRAYARSDGWDLGWGSGLCGHERIGRAVERLLERLDIGQRL